MDFAEPSYNLKSEETMTKSHLVVLGFLSKKSMYGYEIIKFVKERHLNTWTGIKVPSLYKSMKSLHKMGMISVRKQIAGKNPPRNIFTITKKGRLYFQEILQYFLSNTDMQTDYFWLAISFAGNSISKDYFLNVTEKRIQKLEEHISKHCKIEEEYLQKKGNIKIPFNIKILIKMGKSIHQIEVQALNDLKEEIQKKENESLFINYKDYKKVT